MWMVHRVHCPEDDVGSPFYVVPHESHVLHGLCSPVGIRMEGVACWAEDGLDTPEENLSGPCCVPLAFLPGIPWIQLK